MSDKDTLIMLALKTWNAEEHDGSYMGDTRGLRKKNKHWQTKA